MNKKINKIIIIFLVLMMAFPFFSLNVGATESTIGTSARTCFTLDRHCTVRSDGVLFSIAFTTASTPTLNVYRSDDNGETWTQNKTITTSLLSSCKWYPACIGVDKDNTIYCYFPFWDGTHYDICFHKLTSNEQWSSRQTVYNSPYGNSEITGMDVAFDSENMYFAYTFQSDTGTCERVVYRSYNYFFESWNTAVNVVSFTSYNPRLFSPSLSLYGNDKYIFYHDDSGNQIKFGQYHGNNDTWTENVLLSSAYVYHNPCSIVVGSKLYVFYHGTNVDYSNMAIFYKVYDGTSWSSENVIHGQVGYDQLEPTVSANIDGTINVIWSGKSPDTTAYYQLRQKIYSGETWGDTAFVIGGSINKRYARLCYQDYPLWTKLSSGVCITYIDDSNHDLEYIDSGSLSWFSDTGDYTDFEFDANNNIGNLDTGCTMGFANVKTIEFKYMIPTTINATGFDLLVNNVMHGYDSNLSNYDLYINGEPMGNPTEWKGYGGHYVLRWTFTSEKVITNSEILFEVWHDVIIHSNYWYIGVSCNYEDLDGDNVGFLKQNTIYPNGAFDGTWLDKDVAYQLYYNVIQFVEDETDVTYNSISVENTSYYIGESVSLTYTVKATDLVYDNYVRIWNDDTATEITAGSMQGFPYLCTHQLETIGFVSFTSANYTAHLYINNVETDNVSFFVDEHINSDMHVFTYPNPSLVGQKIWVSYNYDHPTNKSGAIFVSLSPNLNNYISVNYLSDGDSGFWNCKHDTVGIYYYIMAVDIDGLGTYGIVDNGIREHHVRSEHGNNYFTLSGYNLRLNEEGTVTQVVNGECNMVSGNCYIYDNNQLVKTITESPFSYNYEIHTAGLHNVEMRLITNMTTVLCTQSYTVTTYSGEDEIEQVEDIGFIVKDYLYNNYGDFGIFIAGVLIILGFMLIPLCLVLCVNVKFNKNMDVGDIHWSMYLIFAIVGVIVVIQLHLADLWIVLLICIVSIAITVITFSKR